MRSASVKTTAIPHRLNESGITIAVPIDFPTLKQWWSDPPRDTEDDRPAVLFTFDDGLLSNYEVGVPLLEEIGCRALFFVVPRFARTTEQTAREFFTSHFLDDPSECQSDADFWRPMNQEQIRDLAERGHTIGNHTLSHSRLRMLAEDEQKREISEAAELIEDWIGRRVETFAWTFKWKTIDVSAWRCAMEHHEYCFAPCAGTTDVLCDSPQLIWRSMVESWYGSGEYQYMYSGATIPMWRRRRAMLEKTFTEAQSGRPDSSQLAASGVPRWRDAVSLFNRASEESRGSTAAH